MMDKNRIGILFIGYNRPKNVEKSLTFILESCYRNFPIFVSIDGPKQESTSDLSKNREIARILGDFKNVFIFRSQLLDRNLGCDEHIPRAVDWAFSNSTTDGLIIIEDDVQISLSALTALGERLFDHCETGNMQPIICMSGLSKKRMKVTNRWRESLYFSAWGYGLTRNFWKDFRKFDTGKQLHSSEILSHSNEWQELPRRKKSIWMERMDRGNYDYRIQKFLFFSGLKAVSPVYRIVDNTGHGDVESTHTRFKAPNYLRKVVSNSVFIFKGGTYVSRFLNLVDSNTWAGDGLLSVRGRNIGLRTLIKRCIVQVQLKKSKR